MKLLVFTESFLSFSVLFIQLSGINNIQKLCMSEF